MFKYGDLVRINRKNEWGEPSTKRYSVVDCVPSDDGNYYLLRDADGTGLKGWHREEKLIKVVEE